MKTIEKVVSKTNTKIPIWFMRQAGRYMHEYMEIRKQKSAFLDLCYDSKNAAEVTIQPIRRFDFDCAIIFSDILVLPHALGWDIEFKEGEGPVLRRFSSSDDFNFLSQNPLNKCSKVYEAINIARKSIANDKSLIGFAGSVWTVMSYMLEGKSKQDFSTSKRFIYENYQLAIQLRDFLAIQTANHLCNQIEAGADAVQMFDSWAGVLSEAEYDDFVIAPTKQVISIIKAKFPNVPVIGFPRNSGFLYEKYIEQTGVNIVGVDQFVPINIMKKWQEKIVVQGNFDPVLLTTKNKEAIAIHADQLLNNLSKQNFIFNLGHGILPQTPVENVQYLVEYIRKHS